MAGVEFSQPILGAGASAQTDLAAARARTGLNFRVAARFKRGLKAELGVEAFADASAELSKFVRASIAGTAFARAQAGIQLQLPLNLFDEFGFAARAEAIAEAAAGLRADLGLFIGDFVLLAERDQNLVGLPLELLLLFLEEVSIGGAFEVNVSASAKAHASITVTGCVIETPARPAGFFYTIDAGVGLAAGVGIGFMAGAEFKDFRRFFGRATDKSVDALVREITGRLPTSAKPAAPILQTFAPVAKIALRIAYDVGQKILQNKPGGSKLEMNTLCNEAVKTILEESQRFLLGQMLDSALRAMRDLLAQKITTIGQTVWDNASQERSALAGLLIRMPDEPFQPTQDNIDYWKSLITASGDLLSKVYGPSADPQIVRSVAVLYCASELLLEAVRSKVNKASAYAMAIGAGTVTADSQPFKGNLAAQPTSLIKAAVNGALGRAAGRDLAYTDLLQFLVNDAVVNPLLAAVPQAKDFLRVFTGDFAKTENELLKMFFQNVGSFVPAAGARDQFDPHETLRLMTSSLDRFMTSKFRDEALPLILANIDDANLRLYLQEVLFEAVVYVKDVALGSILNWEGKSFDNKDFTEALAGVMMLLLGRTVVIVGDTFLTAVQEQTGRTCNAVAAKIRAGDPETNVLNLPVDPDFVRLVANCVEIAGEVLGPLPPETRARVRRLLYQVFEPIPPGTEQDFLDSLADQFFIPNGDDLRELTDELAAISKDRFALFAERFLLAVGNYIFEQLDQIIRDVIDLLLNWETHLADAIDATADVLRDLENVIARLNEQMIDLFQAAEHALRHFFNVLSGSSLRRGIKRALKDLFVDKALGIVEDNDIYKGLPSDWRRTARNLVKSAVDELVDNVVSPVLNAVGDLADELEDLLPDCRELDPDENLPEQVMLLVLEKIEDKIRDHFGSTKPHITVAIDFRVRDFLGNLHNIHIPLGRVDVNLRPFLDAVRHAIQRLDFYHDALNDACFKLADALAKELELAAAQLRKKEQAAEKLRQDRIQSDHQNMPREVTVLNPLPLSCHSKPIDVKIHLGGVPMSFLGLARDEFQHVLIYLNGELIPIKSLVVGGAAAPVSDTNAYAADIDLYRTPGFNSATGVFTNRLTRIITDTTNIEPAHASNTQRQNQSTRFAFSNSKFQGQPVARAIYAAHAAGNGKRAVFNVRTRRDDQGRRVEHSQVDGILPGRANPASHINKALQERIAGIFVQFRLELDQLVEGVNVLTVVVLEKAGNRQVQNVSFAVTKSQPQRPAPSKRPGFANVTLRAAGGGAGRASRKKQPRTPVTLLWRQRVDREVREQQAVTLLPAEPKQLKAGRQQALTYLKRQAALNFADRKARAREGETHVTP